jgi:vacuolar-type H+-ATPase subunit I/STV1
LPPVIAWDAWPPVFALSEDALKMAFYLGFPMVTLGYVNGII